MTMSAFENTFTPAPFQLAIQQGSHFHLEFGSFVDPVTGGPFDFTADPAGAWSARMDVIDGDGNVVVQFARSGKDGVITLGADGAVSADLADEFTAALTPTLDDSLGMYEWRTAPNPLYADLMLIDPADGEKWVWFSGKGHVRKAVTS